ncbi:MAG: transposase [Clostridia bacterium]|nr:transposase [Clostridia bacterium]
MPRFPRSYIKTSFFHIITQGINKNFIFDYPEDIKYYISLMYELNSEYGIKIVAYCIMNNHAHMLLELENIKELSKYMQRLNTKYGKYYNKKYNRVGYVFRDRYKSEGIYSEEHLYSCIKYIYNNPVKAGLCTNPEDYPYSNYKKIVYENNEDYIFMDIEEDKNETCKDVINKFLGENSIDLITLKNDKQKLRQMLIILKDKYGISLRKISQEININRETLRNIYKY